MTVGQTIRAMRIAKGLSIMQVRSKSGLSKSTISEIENDKSSPTVETLEKIADALGTDVIHFFIEETSLNPLNEKTIKTKNNFMLNENEFFYDAGIGEFTSPEQALKFILSQPVIMNYGEYELNKLSEEEIIDLANDMLFAMKLSLEKRKRKRNAK